MVSHKNQQKRWVNSFFLDFLGVLCVFFIYAGNTVPGVNEPHYWTKAAHFWNPDFARGDLFLESGDAHWLFFVTFGYLTQCMPLVGAVWVGRMVTWIALAWAWTLLGRSLWTDLDKHERCHSPLIATCWAAIWLVGMHWGHWAGEWVVGGCESKGIAYACIFAGIAMATRQRWTWCWTSLGIAAAFHVVTGIWVIACLVFVSWVLDGPSSQSHGSWTSKWSGWFAKHRWGWLIGAIGVVVGAIPAMSIDWGIDPKLASESAVKQVYTRLGHHLSPSKINLFRWQSFAFQLGVGCILFWILVNCYWRRNPQQAKPRSQEKFLGNVFPWMVRQWRSLFWSWPRGMQVVTLSGFFAFGIALVGLMLDMGLASYSVTLASKLLRFYWFRWNDVAMPMMLGSLLVAFAYGKLVYDPNPLKLQRIAWLSIVGSSGLLMGYQFQANFFEKIPTGDKAHFVAKTDSEEQQVKQYRDWLRVCAWIRENTEPGALWLTPRRQQSFKWHTGRPELVCWKDAPQNAKSVVEWDKRRADAFHFNEEKILQPWTTDQLWELYKKYDIRYVLLDRRVMGQKPPLLPILYPTGDNLQENENFAVFEIPRQQVNASP